MWAILHLYESDAVNTPLTPERLTEGISRHVPGARVESHAVVDGVVLSGHPLAHYAFLWTDGLSDREILRAERAPFVQRVLCVPGTRVPYRIPTTEVEQMVSRSSAPGVSAGDRVRFDIGPYQNLEGTVVRVLGHKVRVKVQLRVGDADVEVLQRDVSRL